MGARQRARRRPRPGQGVSWSAPRRARGRTHGGLSLLLDAITFAVAFGLAVLLYPRMIRMLQRWRSGQVIQAELPDSHQRKAGTPTGGGILFVIVAGLGGLLATAAGHTGAVPSVVALLVGGVIG